MQNQAVSQITDTAAQMKASMRSNQRFYALDMAGAHCGSAKAHPISAQPCAANDAMDVACCRLVIATGVVKVGPTTVPSDRGG